MVTVLPFKKPGKKKPVMLMKKKTKIVVGSYQKCHQPPSITSSDLIGREAAKQKQLVKSMPDATPGPNYYLNEEYYESSVKEQKYESNRKHIISMQGDPKVLEKIARINEPGTSQQEAPLRSFQPQPIQNAEVDHRYTGIDDEPTRDTPLKTADQKNRGSGVVSESSSEEQDNSKKKNHLYKSVNNKGLPEGNNSKQDRNSVTVNQKVNSSAKSITETDGDIVIYIRQPRTKKEHLIPKITVDVGNPQHMTDSDLSAQQVQIHELKREKTKKPNATRKPIMPRKSKSADNYLSPINSNESAGETDEKISSESTEEQIIDTTHYNLTLRSETQVELETGRAAANVKSKAEVKIHPLGSRPGIKEVAGNKSKNREEEEEHSLSGGAGATRPSDSVSDTHSSSSFEEPSVSNFSGFNQSPIKINSEVTEVKKWPKLQFFNHWTAAGDALLENNGKTLRGSYIQDTSLPYIKGGPLDDVYVFSELHFHWGHKDCCGAEHVIDGQRYTLEAHFLYFRKEYGLLKEALKHTDGIAVIAINLNVGGPPNPLLEELIKDVPLLREPDTGTYVPAHSLFSWIKPALSSSRGYFSYKGALTPEPPHVESVTWLIFPEPIIFCCQQSREFRKLKSNKGEPLTKNYRAPQPVNNRPVYYVPLS